MAPLFLQFLHSVAAGVNAVTVAEVDHANAVVVAAPFG